MNNITTTIAGTTAILACLSLPAVADSHAKAAGEMQEGEIDVSPVELYACTFREGKTMEDMVKQNAKWKKWADKAMPGYSAWMIVPFFRSSEEPFDVGWIGAWPDGKSMGAALDAWRNDNEGHRMAYAGIADCSHSLVTAVEVDAPDGPPTDGGLVWFSSCVIDEDSSVDEAYQAHRDLTALYREGGSANQTWLFYPELGAGDIDFDYYAVSTWKNYAELGAGWDIHAAGSWKKAMEIREGKVSCDSPRVYELTPVRQGAADS